jgi:hypothetical protein
VTRDLRLILVLDGHELELDRAEMADDAPLTATGVAKGLRLTARRIETWAAYRQKFREITESLGESA